MNIENEKCVILIDNELPIGIISNTAAILGITIGMKQPAIVGTDIEDSDGCSHIGIIKFPIPILKSNKQELKELRKKLYNHEYDDLAVVDFTDLAQSCKNYNEYIEKMKACPQTELNYIGIAIYGNKKKINKLTGNIPLLK